MGSVYVNPETGKVREAKRRRRHSRRYAQWVTPQRQLVLAKIAVERSNQCFQGHPGCFDWSHYELAEEKPLRRHIRTATGSRLAQVWGLEEIQAPWLDGRTGLPRRDKSRRSWTATKPEIVKGRILSRPDLDIIEDMVEAWKREDREDRKEAWDREKDFLHRAEKGQFGGTFDAVARDVFMANRPEYYPYGMTVSPVNNNKPLAKIRVPSTMIYLFVDLSPAFRKIGYNKRKKILKYGKGVPAELNATVDSLCLAAVRAFWAK